MSRKIIMLILTIFLSNLHADESCLTSTSAIIERYVQRLDNIYQEEGVLGVKEKFDFAFYNWESRLSELEADPSEYLTMYELEQKTKGSNHLGLLEVVTFDGEIILKLSNDEFMATNDIKMHARNVLVQKHLGDMGIAPKVEGVFYGNSLDELKKAHKSNIDKSATFAVAMEKIEEKAFIRFGNEIADDLSFLNKDGLKTAIESLNKIEKALNEFNLNPADLQMIVDPNGKIYIIDMDRFIFKTNLEVNIEANTSAEKSVDLSSIRVVFENLLKEN